jgi:hypothetical protein
LYPLLFQTGYLTVENKIDPQNYLLREPNLEVSEALNTEIVKILIGDDDDELNIATLGLTLRRALGEVDPATLATCFMEILNWIPYAIHLPLENYYHSLILAVLKALSFKVRSEDMTAEGRMDMRLELSQDKLYIFEFKLKKIETEQVSDSADTQMEDSKSKKTSSKGKTKAELMADALKEARDQLIDKGYAQRDEREYAQVHKVAVGIVGRSQVCAELVI